MLNPVLVQYGEDYVQHMILAALRGPDSQTSPLRHVKARYTVLVRAWVHCCTTWCVTPGYTTPLFPTRPAAWRVVEGEVARLYERERTAENVIDPSALHYLSHLHTALGYIAQLEERASLNSATDSPNR
jgi:hypothetical protein